MKTLPISLAAAFAALLAVDVQATPQTDMIERLEKAVQCQAPEIDAHNQADAAALRKLGATISGMEEDGPPDLDYAFKRPIKLFGLPVRQIHFEADSGSIFYAVFDSGDKDLLIKWLRLKPIPERKRDVYGWGVGQYYRGLNQDKQGRFWQLIVLGEPPGAPPGAFAIGCQALDG